MLKIAVTAVPGFSSIRRSLARRVTKYSLAEAAAELARISHQNLAHAWDPPRFHGVLPTAGLQYVKYSCTGLQSAPPRNHWRLPARRSNPGEKCGLGVEILTCYVGANHYHCVAHDPLGRISDFAERLNSMVGRLLNHRWKRVNASFWDNQGSSLVRLADAETIIDRAAYCEANPVQDGLVEDPSEWPGLLLTAADLGRCERVRPKTKFFTARSTMPKVVQLELKLPPQLGHMSIEEYRVVHAKVLALKIEAAKAEMAKAGRTFLGVEKLRRVRRSARATSPHGTYAMVRRHGVKVAPPPG